jgi:hypothetical protein
MYQDLEKIPPGTVRYVERKDTGQKNAPEKPHPHQSTFLLTRTHTPSEPTMRSLSTPRCLCMLLHLLNIFPKNHFRQQQSDELVFDTGCNCHLTHRLDVLHDYHTSPPGSSVPWGSGDRSPILGFGAILFASEVDGEATTIRIPDVALVKGHKTLLGWCRFLQDTDCEFCASAQDACLYRGTTSEPPLVTWPAVLLNALRDPASAEPP